jgi:uncharacterized protein (TIGR03084 family)
MNIQELPQVVDLRAEGAEFDRLLATLAEGDWGRATQFKRWTVDDIVRHLHAGDVLALASATDEDAFSRMLAEGQARRAAGATRTEIEKARVGADLAGPRLHDRWRSTLDRLCGVLAGRPADARLKWAGPDMGVRMFTTARQMEIWSHGQAVYDLMGRDRPEPAARLRNIAELGVRTFGWTFSVRGQPAPGAPPHVYLRGPGGATWEWNAGNAADRVSGDAVAFCQVVTQTRNVADTALVVEGDVARQWMSIAQCFAGPPETPPPPGTRHRS